MFGITAKKWSEMVELCHKLQAFMERCSTLALLLIRFSRSDKRKAKFAGLPSSFEGYFVGLSCH